MNNPFIPNSSSPTTIPNTPMPGAPAASTSFEVDLTDVQEQSYVIPDGVYKAKCVDITQEVSKSGNPMFVWTFELVGGQYEGKQFKSWTAVTPAAMWKVAEIVTALGVGQTGQVVKFKRTDVINKECCLNIEEDEYNGKATSKISSVLSLF